MKKVDAGKSKGMSFAPFYLTSLNILPTNESHRIVELKIAFCLALTDYQQRSIGGKSIEVKITQYVNIMNKNRFRWVEKWKGFLDSPTRL